MPRKVISVIGGLSEDTILRVNQMPEPGAVARADKHVEVGGKGANTAIAAWRASHRKPNTPDGLVPAGFIDNDDGIEVRIVGAVADESRKRQFTERMQQNGVNPDQIDIKGGSQDYSMTWMDGKTGQMTQAYNFGSSDYWVPEDFDSIDKIGGGVTPDLIVVTMELELKVVEQIIDTASDAGVELILYASPGELMLAERYPKITHLILNQNDAAKMLGYKKLEDVNSDTWPEIVDNFFTSKQVKNVVLKVGHLGAYFKNEHEEGYSSGYKKVNEIIDQSGATAAFVGSYAVELLRHREKNDWSIKSTVERGNIACAVVVAETGYQSSLPWTEELDTLQADPAQQPLFSRLEDLKVMPKKKKFGWKKDSTG